MVRRNYGWIILGLNGFLLFLYASGYLSAYLPPEPFWWTGVPATVLPYLAVLVLVGSIVFLWQRRWMWCAINIVLALLVLPRLPGIAGAPGINTEVSENALIVMSYNVPPPQHYGNDREQVRASLYDLVDEAKPHVLALQGAVVLNGRFPQGISTAWHVDTLLAAGYAPTPPGVGPEQHDVTHQSVFSRLELLEKEYLDLAVDAAAERRATRASFEWNGERAVLFNVHLRSFERRHLYEFLREGRYLRALRNLVGTYRRASILRADEARRLRLAMEQEDGPVIVAGDLNSTPYHWVYRHLARGFTDVHVAGGRGWGGTWHSRFPFVRIDHILVSSHWHVVSARVLSSDLSDHLPVVVQLQSIERE